MKKLPVFATWWNAVKFTIGNLPTIFRLSWFPFTLFFLVYAASFLASMRVGPFADGAPYAMLRPEVSVFLALIQALLQVMVISTVAVAIHRIILFGDRKLGVWFYFPFGGTEFLYALMCVFSFLAILSIMAAVIGPVVYLIMQSDPDARAFVERIIEMFRNFPPTPEMMREQPPTNPAALRALSPVLGAYFVGWILVLWLFLRLAIWPPSIVATNSIGPGSAWQATNGNVFRFLGLFALTVVSVWLIIAPIFIYIATTNLPMAPPGPMPTPSLENVNDAGKMREVLNAQFQPLRGMILGFMAFQYFVNIIFTALTVALVSFAYKALNGFDAREPIPQA